MFLFFKKSISPDKEKIKAFSDWFVSINNDLIKTYFEGNRMKYLDEVENQLAIVYRDGYKGNIEFQYGYDSKANVFELFLFHKNKKFLIEATEQIQLSLLAELGPRWKIYCEK